MISRINFLTLLQLFHYVGHMTYGSVDLGGQMQVSTFFLLSGFCLTLRHGSPGQEDGLGSVARFLLVRLARIGPTYYIANTLALCGW